MRTKSRSSRALVIAPALEGSAISTGRELSELHDDTRGVVFVEYVALLVLVTIMGAAAVLSLGVPLIHLFRFQQLMLSLPIP